MADICQTPLKDRHFEFFHAFNALVQRLAERQRLLYEKQKALEHRNANKALDNEIDWNGADVTPDTLIQRLNETQHVYISLQDEDGNLTKLEITPEDAHLLPPGRYALRTLLKVLAAHCNLEWELGAGNHVILKPRRPRPEKPFEGTGNLIPGKPDKEALWELRGEVAKLVKFMSPEEKKHLYDDIVAEQRRKAQPDGDAQ